MSTAPISTWTTDDTRTASPREVAGAGGRRVEAPRRHQLIPDAEPPPSAAAATCERTPKGGQPMPRSVLQRARRPPRERAVLDSAHVGDIQGAFGTIGQHDTGGGAAALPRARTARDRRAGADRDGRRQRRRRRGDLLAGRTELRHEPALGADPADPGADRQPGDGRASRRGHRRRARQADQRALRPLLGLVLGRRPVPAELPDDRHRVHRRQPGARLFRHLAVHLGADRRRRWSRSPRAAASVAGSG